MSFKLLTCTSAAMLTIGASALGAGVPTAVARPGNGRCGPESCQQVGSWVSPFFNPLVDNWGFGFLGVWTPL
jgi:hypothetical protein